MTIKEIEKENIKKSFDKYNFDFSELCTIKRVLYFIKLKNYYNAIDELLDLCTTDKIFNLLNRRGYYDKDNN